MIEEAKELDELIEDRYVPTSSERKKALLMYFLLGIILSLTSREKSVYERFHLKQAMGWWMIFFLLSVVLTFLMFIPFIRILPILVFIIMFIVWIFFVKQAWEGSYMVGNDKVVLPFFSGIGSWLYVIFEVEENEEEQRFIEEGSPTKDSSLIEETGDESSDSYSEVQSQGEEETEAEPMNDEQDLNN